MLKFATSNKLEGNMIGIPYRSYGCSNNQLIYDNNNNNSKDGPYDNVVVIFPCCHKHYEKRYDLASHVSHGVFVNFIHKWRDILLNVLFEMFELGCKPWTRFK